MDSVSKAAPTLSVVLGYAEAKAYARHLRLVRLVDYERHTQHPDEAYDMLEAGEKILKQLGRAGF